MYKFWYDYIKFKYQNNAKLCYMDTDSLIINTKTKDVYEYITDDFEKRFDTSNYECNSTEFNRPLLIVKTRKSLD